MTNTPQQEKAAKPRRWEKHSYDINTVENGDYIAVLCDHNNGVQECNRFLKMRVVYNSTMQCYHEPSKTSFDMRNQVWQCHQHRT